MGNHSDCLLNSLSAQSTYEGYERLAVRLRKLIFLGWRDGSVVKSIACNSKGPEFNSQQLHGGSQPSVKRSDALLRPQTYRQYTENTVYIINKSLKN